MSLLKKSTEDCVLYSNIKSFVPDGYGGGSEQYKEVKVFKAAVVLDNSIQARAAQKQGVTALYTVTTGRDTVLGYHDMFKRIRDGKTFRVTSDGDDNATPKSTALDMRQVSAEEIKTT